MNVKGVQGSIRLEDGWITIRKKQAGQRLERGLV